MNMHEGRWGITQEDKRLWALHLFVFGLSTGFFILMPVLSYQLLCRPGTDAAYVAFLNNLRCICQDLSMIPAAYAVRRAGARRGLVAAALYAGNLLFALGMVLFMPAKNSAFAALQGRVGAGMLVGIHGVLTSAGSASLGSSLGASYGEGPVALRLVLLTGGMLLAAMLGWLSPKELQKRSGGIP